MTISPDDNPLADDVPVADAAEQRQPVDISSEDAGLDPHHLTDLLARDADPAEHHRPGHHRGLARRGPRSRQHRLVS
jgi:hypothetical protein